MTEQTYRNLFDRAGPSRALVEDTLAAERTTARRRVPVRRLAAAGLCLGVVLGGV